MKEKSKSDVDLCEHVTRRVGITTRHVVCACVYVYVCMDVDGCVEKWNKKRPKVHSGVCYQSSRRLFHELCICD